MKGNNDSTLKNRIWINLRYNLPMHLVLLLTQWLPDNRPFLALRGFLARPFFGSCGSNLLIGRNMSLYNPSKIHFGNWIYIAYGTWLSAAETITVDDEVRIGPYCIITSVTTEVKDGSYRFGRKVNKPVKIGKGSWLGGHVTVTAGVTIGDGVVVGANSVVTKDVPSGTKIGGIPAKPLNKNK